MEVQRKTRRMKPNGGPTPKQITLMNQKLKNQKAMMEIKKEVNEDEEEGQDEERSREPLRGVNEPGKNSNTTESVAVQPKTVRMSTAGRTPREQKLEEERRKMEQNEREGRNYQKEEGQNAKRSQETPRGVHEPEQSASTAESPRQILERKQRQQKKEEEVKKEDGPDENQKNKEDQKTSQLKANDDQTVAVAEPKRTIRMSTGGNGKPRQIRDVREYEHAATDYKEVEGEKEDKKKGGEPPKKQILSAQSTSDTLVPNGQTVGDAIKRTSRMSTGANAAQNREMRKREHDEAEKEKEDSRKEGGQPKQQILSAQSTSETLVLNGQTVVAAKRTSSMSTGGNLAQKRELRKRTHENPKEEREDALIDRNPEGKHLEKKMKN